MSARRVAFLVLVLAAAGGSLPVSAASTAPASAAPAIRIEFTGAAAGHFVDVERWVLLSSNECYLRRTRDQRSSVTWTVDFAGSRKLSGASQSSVTGTVRGTEVRDSCDDVAEELPPDAPVDWLRSISCADPLQALRPARASWANGVLRLSAPVVAPAKNAACTALPRSEEFNVRIRLPVSRISKLKRGTQITVAVGSNRPGNGVYRPQANCAHPAKPYDGYRSYDRCIDMLAWSGSVTITRI